LDGHDDGVTGGGLLSGSLEILFLLVTVVIDTDETGGLLGSLGVQWNASHGVVLGSLLDHLLVWNVILCDKNLIHRAWCLVRAEALVDDVGRGVGKAPMSREGLAITHMVDRTDRGKVSVWVTIHARVRVGGAMVRDESVRVVRPGWWGIMRLTADEVGWVHGGRNKGISRCVRAHVARRATEGRAIEKGRRSGVGIGTGRSRKSVMRIVEGRVQLMAVEGHPIHCECWVGEASGAGRQVLIAHLRVTNLWEATVISVPVVEIAITVAVMAGVVVSLEVSSTRGETPIVGLGARDPITRALNGALKERAAVHVEQVKVVLVVFLEVLGVRGEN
jgi:hypothetical protein